MNLAAVGTGISTDAPNNPGPAVFYARVGSPSPADPNTEQLITDRGPNDWMNTIQNAATSALSLFNGGSSTPAKLASAAAASTTQAATFQAAKIKGEVGKVYYGAVSSVAGAVASTATTVKNVATGISITSGLIVLVIGIVLLAQFRIASKGV